MLKEGKCLQRKPWNYNNPFQDEKKGKFITPLQSICICMRFYKNKQSKIEWLSFKSKQNRDRTKNGKNMLNIEKK
jgi:hypothetical protein